MMKCAIIIFFFKFVLNAIRFASILFFFFFCIKKPKNLKKKFIGEAFIAVEACRFPFFLTSLEPQIRASLQMTVLPPLNPY